MDQKPLWIGLTEEVNMAKLSAIAEQKKSRNSANIEIEVQFGTYLEPESEDEAGSLILTVSPSAFTRLMTIMKRLTPNYENTVTEDEISNKERVSFNPKTNQTEYLEKKRIYSSYVSYFDDTQKKYITNSSSFGIKLASDYNMKISVANEYSFKSESKYFRPTMKRIKKRTSFDFRYQYGGYLDLTIVEETKLDSKDPSKTKYEVEFEVTEPFDKFRSQIEKFSLLILAILQDSVIPYTNTQKINMYKYVGGLLNTYYRKLKFSMLPEARDLKITDMVEGGVVGSSITPYCVTHKADGVRKLIVTTATAIWSFVPGTSDASLIYTFEESEENSVAPFAEGFIFDGELLTKENRRDTYESKYVFYIFDCLCENKQDIRYKTYPERMELALQFTEYPMIEIENAITQTRDEPFVRFREFQIKSSKINRAIKFLVKGYLSLVSVEHFFETMRLMFLQQTDLIFKQDGFMFIPMNTCYNPYDPIVPLPQVYLDAVMYRNAPPIYKRSLTNYPDICKWKPVELRSIDFIVDKRGQEIVLKSVEGNTLKVFTGNDTHPLNNRIDVHHPILESIGKDVIVEFYWDAKKQLLTPSRIRSDKPSPNKFETAKLIWDSIFRGIDQETLVGESFQLMREYHNQIKRDLYQNSQELRNQRVLLDIGSGRGGDLNKWDSYDLIFAVEPNPEHQKELLQRLKTSNINPRRVILIPTTGEDYEQITKVIREKYGDLVSTVSLMLSFSFFYDKAREGVRKTIENNLELGGQVLVFTIDGDTVEQVFRPSSGEYKEKTLKFLNSEMTYEPKSGNVYIDIPGTIVTKQKERPPKLSQLFTEWTNFLPIRVSRADKRSFLNSGEKPFSNMYTSFTWIYLSNKMFEIEIERIVPYEKLPLIIEGEKYYGPVKDWSIIPNGMYGISIIPSDYFFLSAVLKALDPVYQENNNLEFRKTYVTMVWNHIYDTLSPNEQQIYQLPWNFNILKIFSRVFEVQILYVHGKKSYRYTSENANRKIVIVESYLIGIMDDERRKPLIQVLF